MHREYKKWFSHRLGREMEMLVFGHAGQPVLVFPTSMGRFFDYEERQMIQAISSQYENGHLQAFCVDSVDSESWYDKSVHPSQRAARHVQYDAYLLDEVVPMMQERSGAARIAVTGCSFGGYHTMNFALKHPELVSYAVSMGGAFDIHQFLGGYYDDNCYFNCPPDFVPNLGDERVLNEYRANLRIVLAAGETDICLAENLRMAAILREKQIPHNLDVWGEGAGHDWPWWRQMAGKFFG